MEEKESILEWEEDLKEHMDSLASTHPTDPPLTVTLSPPASVLFKASTCALAASRTSTYGHEPFKVVGMEELEELSLKTTLNHPWTPAAIGSEGMRLGCSYFFQSFIDVIHQPQYMGK